MNILRTTLSNGLKVLIQEIQTAPVVSVWVWYHVGSRHEHTGITGVSHWLEHMLFKGTARWGGDASGNAIAREGGIYNAMTWYDFTAYYETLPSTRLALALDIESDRMHNARFDSSSVESERSVIISERQGSENSPQFLLGEEVRATAYHVHPYGHQTIGQLCDLQSITYEDLFRHYQQYYSPDNAVITIAGDINAGEAARLIERFFADLPRREREQARSIAEPVQRGGRRTIVEGGGQTEYLEIAYHVPEARNADFHALTVLNAVLTGGASFLIGRGSLTNHTSRLYQALVERELAIDIDGDIVPTVDPGLYRLTATVWPGRELADLEQALLTEIDRIQATVLSRDELRKAQQQARALFAYASESITHQAFWMGFTDVFADYSWYQNYLERIEAVTVEDIQRVARAYLTTNNQTVGWYRVSLARNPAPMRTGTPS